VSWLHSFDPSASITESGSILRLEVSPETILSDIVSPIEQAQGKVISINPVRQTMEDYFFTVVGKGERKAPSHSVDQ
jgi:hypothetical protein